MRILVLEYDARPVLTAAVDDIRLKACQTHVGSFFVAGRLVKGAGDNAHVRPVLALSEAGPAFSHYKREAAGQGGVKKTPADAGDAP